MAFCAPRCMSSQAAPLFQRRTLDAAVASFPFPPDLLARQARLVQWLTTLKSGTLDEVKETSLHGEFLADVFRYASGHRTLIDGGGKDWELHAERTIAAGGGSADGALGLFHATAKAKGGVRLEGRLVAPIELKGAATDLDYRPASGRRESAVEQGWRYANYTPDCRWIVVSNYRELRLYHTAKTPAYYERFELGELADLATFRRFYYLLCRVNFLPDATGLSVTDWLLAASSEAQERVTDRLYAEYKALREGLVEHFLQTGPADVPERECAMVEAAQKVLDRALFIAFCEDRHLLPPQTLKQAHDYRDPYHPHPVWERYRAVFRWIDQGHDDPPIPGYNGGLFRHDPLLDKQLHVPDGLCGLLKDLAKYDYADEVSVDVLGHIFEQSVTDLEELRAEAQGVGFDRQGGKRKREGVFYTPAFITQYIAATAIGSYLSRREEELRQRHATDKRILKLPKRQREIRFWEDYQEEVLRRTRVLDPACGSGAFLIAAFDYLLGEYRRVRDALTVLREGKIPLFDLNKTILNENLFGVDLSAESVEITKLSLWLKTAERGRTLTDLDDNVRVGNSVVDDPVVDPRAFDWPAAFPQVFADGGFDVVLGNPPYVRQEWIAPLKPHLRQHYASYDSVADLYVYFYERGLRVLRPGGVLSYIVTNKWLRAGYGAPLRRFFAAHAALEQLIDFGHAPIFKDADTFPCIVVTRREVEREGTALVSQVPREQLKDLNLPQYVEQHGHFVPQARFGEEVWSLDPPAVDALRAKLSRVAVRLQDYVGARPLAGIKTGYNDAFLLDSAQRDWLVDRDPQTAELLQPYFRGQDVDRWRPDWNGLWMLVLKSSENHPWPWHHSGPDAEAIFARAYPAVYQHLKPMEQQLRKRQDQGRHWWELRSCAYYEAFGQPKLVYQEIQFYPAYALDTEGMMTNNTVLLIPTSERYLLAVLNSPLMWWHNWRYLNHGKDEALRPFSERMVNLPIGHPADEVREAVTARVDRLLSITATDQEALRSWIDWLRLEHGVTKPGQRLEQPDALTEEQLFVELRTRRPQRLPLSPASVQSVRAALAAHVGPWRERAAARRVLEKEIFR